MRRPKVVKYKLNNDTREKMYTYVISYGNISMCVLLSRNIFQLWNVQKNVYLSDYLTKEISSVFLLNSRFSFIFFLNRKENCYTTLQTNTMHALEGFSLTLMFYFYSCLLPHFQWLLFVWMGMSVFVCLFVFFLCMQVIKVYLLYFTIS